MTPDYMGRVLADSRNRPEWLQARVGRIGASNAAGFAKIESADKYVAQILNTEFRGNRYTDTGNTWEAPALAAAGFEQNTLMFYAAGQDGYTATPDGIRRGPGGAGLVLAEAKTKLVRGPFDPDMWDAAIPPGHARQIAWAQFVLGADATKYIVLPYDEHHTPLLMRPREYLVPRDDALIAHLLTIAPLVLRGIRAALAFERSISHGLD